MEQDVSKRSSVYMSGEGLEVNRDIYLTSEDMRQYVYCPRVIYFRYVMHIRPQSTFKMTRGEEIHEKEVRKKSKDIEGQLTKYYNLYIQDRELNIAAILDYLEFDGTQATPVDIKTGHCYQDPISDHHLAQLLFQAILVEMKFKIAVNKVKVVYKKDRSERTYPVSVDDKVKILKNINKIRNIVKNEMIPPPTPNAAKCVDCEFWNYCQRA
ncbi:MAG: CRISPR-associated protein Cas4 [Candidatus Helarchaeota archaeon]